MTYTTKKSIKKVFFHVFVSLICVLMIYPIYICCLVHSKHSRIFSRTLLLYSRGNGILTITQMVGKVLEELLYNIL